MAYQRHSVFNIGPMGDPIADPGFAEQLALRKQQFAESQAQQSLQAQVESSLARLERERESERAQDIRYEERRNWDYEHETLPDQQRAMLSLLLGQQGKAEDRALRESEQVAQEGHRNWTKSFKEREALRTKTYREDERSSQERQHRESQIHAERLAGIRSSENIIKERLKIQEKSDKEARTRKESALKESKQAALDTQKKLEEERNNAAKTIREDEHVTQIVQKIAQGQGLSPIDKSIIRSLSYGYSEIEKEFLIMMLSAALTTFESEKASFRSQKEQEFTGQSDTWLAKLFGNSGTDYIAEKMRPIDDEISSQTADLRQLLDELDA